MADGWKKPEIFSGAYKRPREFPGLLYIGGRAMQLELFSGQN
jgi:hypothetical protein